MGFSLKTVVYREIMQRKGRMVSGLLAITLGIAVIVAIQSVTSASKRLVAKKLD